MYVETTNMWRMRWDLSHPTMMIFTVARSFLCLSKNWRLLRDKELNFRHKILTLFFDRSNIMLATTNLITRVVMLFLLDNEWIIHITFDEKSKSGDRLRIEFFVDCRSPILYRVKIEQTATVNYHLRFDAFFGVC